MGDRGPDWAEALVSGGDVNLGEEKTESKKKKSYFQGMARLDC